VDLLWWFNTMAMSHESEINFDFFFAAQCREEPVPADICCSGSFMLVISILREPWFLILSVFVVLS
jgi:hypothetical protein